MLVRQARSLWAKEWVQFLAPMVRQLLDSLRDLAPIVLVIGFFQIVVLRQPFPDLGSVAIGMVSVLVGWACSSRDWRAACSPWASPWPRDSPGRATCWPCWHSPFAWGFGTTVAEPALIAIAGEAADVAAEAGTIDDTESARGSYALTLRLVVAVAVGIAIVVGVLRILKGWPVHWLIIGGYLLVTVMTLFAPEEIIGVAYDSGGVTTSTITVPLVAALGVGLAASIRSRSPMVDGFGLIAFASLTPMICVLGYGLVA